VAIHKDENFSPISALKSIPAFESIPVFQSIPTFEPVTAFKRIVPSKKNPVGTLYHNERNGVCAVLGISAEEFTRR
jgi:hypothetical protein